MKSKLLQELNGQRTFAVIFETGDEVASGLADFAAQKQLAAAHFTAIGALRDVTLGYFDWEKKDYSRISVAEQVEVLALVGDVAWDASGKPKVHAHLVVGRMDGTTRGGHLLEAHVRPTLEVVLVESPAHLQRRHDPESSLALITL
ncbi:MAG TPA: PPC domain-containing DNA-binding protein [Pirellulales bacterium]|jgi:hypothetical protein